MEIKEINILSKDKIEFTTEYGGEDVKLMAEFSAKEKLVNVRTRHSRVGGTKETWQSAGWTVMETPRDFHPSSLYWFKADVVETLNQMFPEGVQAPERAPEPKTYEELLEVVTSEAPGQVEELNSALKGICDNIPRSLLEEILEQGQFSQDTLREKIKFMEGYKI